MTSFPILNSPLLHPGEEGVPIPCCWLRPKALADLLSNVDTIKVLRALTQGPRRGHPSG